MRTTPLVPRLALLSSLCLPLALGCAGPSTEEAPRCLKLTSADDGLSTNLPARVSVLFSVETCLGQPVTGLSVDQFTIAEDGREISAFESQRSVKPKGQKFRMYSMLLLDVSGSILRSGNFPALRQATEIFIERVLNGRGEGQRVALYTFDGREEPVPVVDFTNDPAALRAGLERLATSECQTSSECAAHPDRKTCAGWLCVDDSTNLHGAILRGLDKLEGMLLSDRSIAYREASLVVFTDGADQASRVSQSVALERVKASEVSTFTIGLAGDTDERALRLLGTAGFQPATKAEELTVAFEKTAAHIVSQANRFYLLEYCSPRRGGTHQLTVTATFNSPAQGKLVGEFSRTFDATGFTSGCALEQSP